MTWITASFPVGLPKKLLMGKCLSALPAWGAGSLATVASVYSVLHVIPPLCPEEALTKGLLDKAGTDHQLLSSICFPYTGMGY